MKTNIVFFIVALLCICIVVFGGDIIVKNSSGSSVFRIRGAGTDSSITNPKGNPIQSFTYAIYDTSSSDSVAGTVDYQIFGAKNEWQTIKTLTITSSDTSYWNITTSAIPPEVPWRLLFTGGTGNKTGTDAAPAYSCWELKHHYSK